MIANLKPVKHRIWITGILSILTVSIIFAVIYYGLSLLLVPPQLWAVMACIGLLLLIAGTHIIASHAIEYIDYLARAVLIVSHKHAQVETPNLSHLASGREFLGSLAQSIYRLNSRDNDADSQDAEIPTHNTGLLLHMLPLPVIAINSEGVIVFANEAAASYIQKPHETLEGSLFVDACRLSFVNESTLRSWIDRMRSTAVVADEVWERVRLQVDDNTRKQLDLVAHFSKDDPNDYECLIVMYDRTRIYEHDDHDLTFVSLAVHELRTPLTIMRGYIEVFEDELKGKLTNEQAEFMTNMSASAQQLSAFVSNILNVVRVDENAMRISMKEESWPQVVENTCHDISLRAQVHGKKILFDIPANLPTVAVDKSSIHEVMNNLLDNAIKYTHTDETITVTSRIKDGFIETEIMDHGVGIPAEVLPHIFEKFYRAHTSKNSVSGTGLGLYLSKSIIQAHGGRVWVTSKVGQGSTFGFSLPIFETVAKDLSAVKNGEIVRGAHGWIKNHTLYRG